MKSPEGFNIADPSFNIPEQSALALTPEAIFADALKTLPEFRAAEFNMMKAEKGLAYARGARYPRLSLFGSLNSGYSSASQRITGEKVPFSDQIDENFNKSLGLSMSIPIFNGWSAHSNVKSAKLNVESVRFNEQLTRNQVYKSIVQAHSDANAALKKYQASEKAKLAASESYIYAEKRYNLGLLSSIEFTNVRNLRSRAESDFLQAKYDLIFRLKIIDFYLGKPLAF
jgi:outer membrane protein